MGESPSRYDSRSLEPEPWMQHPRHAWAPVCHLLLCRPCPPTGAPGLGSPSPTSPRSRESRVEGGGQGARGKGTRFQGPRTSRTALFVHSCLAAPLSSLHSLVPLCGGVAEASEDESELVTAAQRELPPGCSVLRRLLQNLQKSLHTTPCWYPNNGVLFVITSNEGSSCRGAVVNESN